MRLQKADTFLSEMFTGFTVVPAELPHNLRDLLCWEVSSLSLDAYTHSPTYSLTHLLIPYLLTYHAYMYTRTQTQPMYIQITNQFQKITRSASRILSNVKAKGQKRGDLMDANVEKLLFAQISEEALAREIVSVYRKILTQQNRIRAMAILSKPPALPSVQPALEKTASGNAMRQDSFLGPDWSELLRADLTRFLENERASFGSVSKIIHENQI